MWISDRTFRSSSIVIGLEKHRKSMPGSAISHPRSGIRAVRRGSPGPVPCHRL